MYVVTHTRAYVVIRMLTRVYNYVYCLLLQDLLGPLEGASGAKPGLSDRQSLVRLLCKFKASVGGIGVKELFELNVQPLSLKLTKRFHNTVMHYFFPGRRRSSAATAAAVAADAPQQHRGTSASTTTQ